MKGHQEDYSPWCPSRGWEKEESYCLLSSTTYRKDTEEVRPVASQKCMVAWCKATDKWGHKKCHADTTKVFLTTRMVNVIKHWNSLPRQFVQSQNLVRPMSQQQTQPTWPNNTYFKQTGRLNDFQRSLLTQIILWSCALNIILKSRFPKAYSKKTKTKTKHNPTPNKQTKNPKPNKTTTKT